MFSELGIYKQEAEKMTAQEFANKYNSFVRDWGKPIPQYDAVNVLGTDYLWFKSTGKYDGWDKYFCDDAPSPII